MDSWEYFSEPSVDYTFSATCANCGLQVTLLKRTQFDPSEALMRWGWIPHRASDGLRLEWHCCREEGRG